MLASGSGRTIGVDLKIGRINFELDLLSLGQNRNGGRRGMYPAAGLGFRNALNTMAAGFKLQARICTLPFDNEAHFLYAAKLGFVYIDNIYLPALALGIHGIHAEKIMREKRAFLSADAGADLHYDVALIVRVFGQKQDLKLLAKLTDALLCVVIFLLGKLLELRVGHQLLGVMHGLFALDILSVCRNYRLKLFNFPCAFGICRRVCIDLAVFHALAKLGISVIKLFKFIQHRFLLIF